jgi:hypothetical protein
MSFFDFIVGKPLATSEERAEHIGPIAPISFAIIGLLAIVYASYLQTIDAYPHGSGSYTVAPENLGAKAGLLAAAALMIDYILNAAAGISAGVGALVTWST